ncbi:hypothetical protein Ancab_039545 [Ancistrocladus abbreviatus]
MAESAIASAAQWIAMQMANKANFLLDVEVQLLNLTYELNHIQQHLRDAYSPEEVGDSHIHIFTQEIRDIAFRAEDVIDTYILSVASLNEDGNFSGGRARSLDPSFFIRKLDKDIQAIVTGLREAFQRLQQYQVPGAIVRAGPSNNNPRKRARNYKMVTYPHTDDGYFVGREDDIEKLVQWVTGMNYSGEGWSHGEGCSQEARDVAVAGAGGVGETTLATETYSRRRPRCSQEVRVVAIVGAAGIGKTTLARRIYNDSRVKEHFSRVAWVTISQYWDIKTLLLQILRQTGGISYVEGNSLKDLYEEDLVAITHGFLSENPHLIVLDDMWTTEAWDCVCDALPLNKGSKVIFTTRNNDLPSRVRCCFVHELSLLTDEQSLNLFFNIVLEDEGIGATTDDFSRLGTEMTLQCDGLPLAVSVLGGLLRTKHTLEEWEHVSETFGSLLLKVKGPAHYGKSVYQTLMLSYHDLPCYLKPCFLYLALFPEDTEIEIERLIQMWIAEGFVLPDRSSLEVVARQYLDELICRCMVLRVTTYDSLITRKCSSIRLHDMMREFCIAKANDERFLEVHLPNDQRVSTSSRSDQSRRVSILPGGTFSPTQHSHIRSFIQFGLKDGSITVSLPALCTEHFQLVRILIVDGVETHDGYLPETFGNLRHLRYLALTHAKIKTLPESIGNLSNLLYLKYTLNYKTEGETLPNVLWKMKLLRHLCLAANIKCPDGFKLHTLCNLQTLWKIGGTYSEEEMERMSPSLEKLGIVGIESQSLLDVVFRSPFVNSGSLVKLDLQWRNGVKLESMEPLYNHCQRLRDLCLLGKIGNDCALQFPPSLFRLELILSMTCNDPMAAVGRLCQLKSLLLNSYAYIGAEMTCNAGSFPQLEELTIFNLDNLEEWRVEKGTMPQLKKLYILHCRKLKRLPEELQSIRSLQTLNITAMPRSFCHRLFGQGDKTNYEYPSRSSKQRRKNR